MDFAINFVKIISIIAGGFFGALGLLTKYKDDETGKINKWGKVAFGGIIFSALLSLSLQFIETSKEAEKQRIVAETAAIEARKAEESAKAITERLENILATAKKTSDQQEKSLNDSNLLKSDLQTSLEQQRRNLSQTEVITGKMDASLKAQDMVLNGNKDILKGIIEGEKRDTDNTIGILRTVWNESNRVEAGQISVAVTFTFSSEIEKPPPLLFADGETLSLRALPKTSAQSVSFPWNRWNSNHLLDDKELSLKANENKISRKEHFSTDGVAYTQTNYFSDFDGDMNSFVDMTKWNGAVVEILLTKQDPSLVGKLKDSLDWQEGKSDSENFRNTYDVPKDIEEYDYRIMPLPINATLVIYLRERPIATSEAVLAKVWEHDEDVRSLIVAKFKITKISENTFPYFKPTF